MLAGAAVPELRLEVIAHHFHQHGGHLDAPTAVHPIAAGRTE